MSTMDISTPSPDVASFSEEKPLPLPLDLSHHLSEVTKRRIPSKIKQVYELFQIPGIGNLAGGLPNVRFFPFDTLEAQTASPERWTPSPNYPGEPATPAPSEPDVAAHIAVPKISAESDYLKKIDLASALQYGTSQGYPPLLSWVRQFTREHLHPDVPYRGGPDIVMTCGATDGFAKALHLFVNPWNADTDNVRERPGLLCETFVYGNVLSEALPLGMHIAPVKADNAGMLTAGPGGLEDVLASWDPTKGKRPHIMYLVTLGHNPTGIVLSIERKKEIYAVCSKYDVIIIEDEPYWYLQFPSASFEEAKSRGEPTPDPTQPYRPASSSGYPFLDSLAPSFLSIDTDGRVFRLDTFSKTIAPGCRLGWVTAQPALVERLVRISETSTQQPSGFVQSLVAELVMGSQPEAKAAFSLLRTARQKAKFAGWQMDGWVRWLEGLRGMYERRMSRMCKILDGGADLLNHTAAPSLLDWHFVSKTKLFSYDWPRGGMFIWLRIHLEHHPLYLAPGTSGAAIDGPTLSAALMMFLTTKPYLVLAGMGSIFSATDAIREQFGWAYYRICFAAESEENVDACSQRFVDGLHAFWRVTSAAEIDKLLESLPHALDSDDGDEEIGNLGGWLGC
ncbi:pyridoxal phosphate-dependent transferase [Lasiosphaeris hirsuta]|uniref:Pyridoxal phosphate-dependent transferase n=1 Tax=Lasiosphaeris hirsuta TaxID=260670 RepID=A0AA40DY91_9PEZI|nr:pyridoxal phosphate-dependent transferase [Lasiosphaeris hirsuta]